MREINVEPFPSIRQCESSSSLSNFYNLTRFNRNPTYRERERERERERDDDDNSDGDNNDTLLHKDKDESIARLKREKKKFYLNLCPMTEREGGSRGRTEGTIADGERPRL